MPDTPDSPDLHPVVEAADESRTIDAPDSRRSTGSRRTPHLKQALTDFARPSRTQLVVGVILLLCALAVTLQIRTSDDDQDYSTLRRTELVQMLDDLNAESRRLEAEIAALEATRLQLQSGVDRQRVAREEAQKRYDVLSILGGTTPAEGPGIRITIQDPSQRVTPEIILNALEELRDAGAEVIEINDTVRVVASTWVGTGENGLVVDGVALSRPIVIEVIGGPHALSEAVRFRGGLASEVSDERIGGMVSVVSDSKVAVSSLHIPREAEFARPA